MVSWVFGPILFFSLHVTAQTAFAPSWQTIVSDTGVGVDLRSSSTTTWKLESTDQAHTDILGTVPGDVLTDLTRAGIIGDPYVDRNFLTQRHVWMGGDVNNNNGTRTRSWVYSTDFEIPRYGDGAIEDDDTRWNWILVVEGIKMGANIAIDGHHIGTVTDQFLRYTFPVIDHVWSTKQSSTLTITFDPRIGVDGRFAACSGGWDWAPYTLERDTQSRQMFTFGIVKPIYLVAVRDYSISHVVPKVHYLGSYPREPMVHPEGDFEVVVDVHVDWFPSAAPSSTPSPTRRLLVKLPHGDIEGSIDIIPPKDGTNSTIASVSLDVPKSHVSLWWPNGMGMQPLYDIWVQQVDKGENVLPTRQIIKKRIGFRVSSLVTVNETDYSDMSRALSKPSEGSGHHGMLLRVNGAIVMARGANFIPMDQLEGRLSDIAHRNAVESAANANMNMLRVWGGGMVLPNSFYEACDEKGILLYHDMMFVDEEGHGPFKTKTVEMEIRHVVRSLASHTSIVVWNGCNECQVIMGTSTEIYATFVMKTVAEEDDSRSIWPSSPSKHGWKTGVYTVDSRPNGKPLSTHDPNEYKRDLESHGPYMRSFSRQYPGVNGHDFHFPYDNTPPKLKPVDVGHSYPNVFSSEFGSSVMSSFESMTGTLTPSFWGLHGNAPPANCKHIVGNKNYCVGDNVMAQRNYPCDTHILAYFGNLTRLDAVGGQAFREQLYHCLIAQTLWMKGEIEIRRSSNTFGYLIWQFNENWPTGGWGVVEYGPERSRGQVVGGRWKPLMHLLESSLFRDTMAACGADNLCYIRNDGTDRICAHMTLEAWSLRDTTTAQRKLSYSRCLDVGSITWLVLPTNFTSAVDAVVINLYSELDGTSLMESVFLWQMPKDLPGIRSNATVAVESIEAAADGTALVTLSSNHLALYVVLTTRAHGRFSENALVIRPNQHKIVRFVSLNGRDNINMELLERTVRVEHLTYYTSQSGDTGDVAVQ